MAKVDDIIRESRIALDMNYKSSGQLLDLGEPDTLMIEDILRSKVEDAARLVEQEADATLLGDGIPFGSSIEWESAAGYGKGTIYLPDNFLRLVVFMMSDWSRAVTEAITPTHPLYAMQGSRFQGVRGNPEKPVVAIVPTATGKALEFYSCSGGAGTHVRQASYIPVPEIHSGADGDEIAVCPKLIKAVIYRVASLAAQTLGRTDTAAVLLSTSNELAGIVISQ